jgi:hypothetical protein
VLGSNGKSTCSKNPKYVKLFALEDPANFKVPNANPAGDEDDESIELLTT